MSGWKFSLEPAFVPLVNTSHRKITTKIPVPESLEIFNVLDRCEAQAMHGQLPVVWDRAEDFQVYDPYGNCWIDFTSTIFVTNTGHANKAVVEALQKKLNDKLLHTYTFASSVRAKFLEKLIQITPKQFDEATECAVKLMRMHGYSLSSSKNVIISFQGSMHGRTMGAEMLKGDPKTSGWIGYLDPNMLHLPFPYPWAGRANESESYWEEKFLKDMEGLKVRGLDFSNIAGFIIESYLGWGAVFYPASYIQSLCRFAAEWKALTAFDEIQGGFGRTGKLFVYEHYGVEPDMLCLGKAISGGLPLSAVMGSRKIMDLPEFGSMSSTHSANPLCCAAGLANLDEIGSGNIVEESARKGLILHNFLNDLKNKCSNRISHVLAKGLLAAVLIKNPINNEPDGLFASKVCEKAMQKGLLLVHTGRESIKIGPPLTITDEALVEGLKVLEEAIIETDREDNI